MNDYTKEEREEWVKDARVATQAARGTEQANPAG